MRQVVPGPCPTCNTEIEYLYTTENIPYFSDILIISAICLSCGYKFVDTQMLKHGEPVRYTYRTTTQEDLAIRVMRSASATIEIPELGVRIDPGSTCQGFVSNIEGILDRIIQAIGSAIVDGNAEERGNAHILLEKIARVKSGELSVTVVLEDPNGNSVIVADSAERSAYTIESEPYD